MDMSFDLERLVQKMSVRLIADAELLAGDAEGVLPPSGGFEADQSAGHDADPSTGARSLSLSEGSGNISSVYRCTADVGCDHGYVSMYLVMRGISGSAIAMDVRKGPLSQAEANVHEFGLEDKVSLRLSDGLSDLKSGEADSLVIAGMGGRLMMSILDGANLRGLGIRMGVLQPQSDIMQFRQYIRQRGYGIVDERMIFEDGKYYFPMLIDFFHEPDDFSSKVRELESFITDCTGSRERACESALRLSDRYGVYNILRRDELLVSYLTHGVDVNRSILSGLDEREHSERYSEVSAELSDMELLLKLFL